MLDNIYDLNNMSRLKVKIEKNQNKIGLRFVVVGFQLLYIIYWPCDETQNVIYVKKKKNKKIKKIKK